MGNKKSRQANQIDSRYDTESNAEPNAESDAESNAESNAEPNNRPGKVPIVRLNGDLGPEGDAMITLNIRVRHIKYMIAGMILSYTDDDYPNDKIKELMCRYHKSGLDAQDWNLLVDAIIKDFE